MTNKAVGSFFAILFVSKILAIYFTNFNLFGDEAQYWLWSKDLDLGYYSKPPFLSWFISLYTAIFGESFFSLKIFPSFIYILIGLVIYDLGKNVGLNTKSAILCSLLFLFIPAVSFSSFIISTDLFLLLFWTLSLNLLVKIVNKPKIEFFILLGIMLGLAMLSKYAAIYFLLCLIIYFFFDEQFRRIVITNYFGAFLCLFIMIMVVFPNILWNLNNGWVTLQHTSDNANFNNIQVNFFRGLVFILTQIVMVGPVLFIANVINYKKITIDKNKKILLVFSIPIFVVVCFEAIIVRANANWAAPALVSLFLFLYINIAEAKFYFIKLNIFFNFLFCIIFFILIGTSYPSSIFHRIKDLDTYASGVMLEAKKLGINNFVISDRLLFASFNYELKDYKKSHNLNFYMPHKNGEKITNHFKLTSPLNKNMDKSFIFIGYADDIKYLNNKFDCKQKELDITNENILPRFEVCFN